MEISIASAIQAALAAAAVYFLMRGRVGKFNRHSAGLSAAAQIFPVQLSRQTHWARVTNIVEASLAQATDMSSHHAAAARQLEAADYALHCLLGELSQVMAMSVASPLAPRPRQVEPERRQPAAMAA